MAEFLKNKSSKKTQRRTELRLVQIALSVLLGLALACGLILWQVTKDENRLHDLQSQAKDAVSDPNTLPPGKPIGGPFTLTDQDGKTVTDADFKGKYLLVYFGYTYCPDMCPTGLQSVAHALDQLGTDVAKVKPLYITIDPARDTSAVLKQYVASFHPEISGLTGTDAQIAAVAKEYQVYYAKGEEVEEGEYVMDHTSLIYLMAPDGHFIRTFTETVDPAEIVKALKEQWTGVQTEGKK